MAQMFPNLARKPAWPATKRVCRSAPLLILVFTLSLPACSGIQHTRVYTGSQRPTAGTCDPASSATLTRRGTAIVLAAADGTLTLAGNVENNTLAARVTLPGADHVPYPISFTGVLTGQGISGTLTTPRCRYALDLKLTSD